MKYGQGFWAVRDGVRIKDPKSPYAYPQTRGFIYDDGDKGEFLTETFCLDYVPPGSRSGSALRMTFLGNPAPVLHENAFDFDFASVPKLFHTIVCDKADHRIRVPSLGHDMGYCAHEVLPFMTRDWWNEFLVEVMEAYCLDEGVFAHMRDKALRAEVAAGVAIGGGFCWRKTAEEIELYRRMFAVEHVPV